MFACHANWMQTSPSDHRLILLPSPTLPRPDDEPSNIFFLFPSYSTIYCCNVNMEINNFCVLANGGDSFEYVSDAHTLTKKRKFQRFTTVVVSSVRDHVGTRIWSLERRLLRGRKGMAKANIRLHPHCMQINQNQSLLPMPVNCIGSAISFGRWMDGRLLLLPGLEWIAMSNAIHHSTSSKHEQKISLFSISIWTVPTCSQPARPQKSVNATWENM